MKRKLKVTLLVLVIVFSTLSLQIPVSPVYASPAYEDFTTYTEVDPASRLSQTTTRATATGLDGNDGATYLYYDFGVGYIAGDFIYRVDIRITSVVGDYSYLTLWVVANTLEVNTDTIEIYFRNFAGSYRLFMWGKIGASYDDDWWTGIALDTTYYLTIERFGTTVTCKIYSDSGRTALIDTLTITLVSASDFRYLCTTGLSWLNSGADSCSGYAENLISGLLFPVIEDFENWNENNWSVTGNQTSNMLISSAGAYSGSYGLQILDNTYAYNRITKDFSCPTPLYNHTITFMFRATEYDWYESSTWRTLLLVEDSIGDYLFWIAVNSSNQFMCRSEVDWDYVELMGNIQTNQWYSFYLTFDVGVTGSVRVYIDGLKKFDLSADTSSWVFDGDLNVGVGNVYSTDIFEVHYDDVGVYDEIIPPSKVEITNMEGCGDWVFAEQKYYHFESRHYGINLSTFSFSGIYFIDDGGQKIECFYDYQNGVFSLFEYDLSGEEEEAVEYVHLQDGGVTNTSYSITVTYDIFFTSYIDDSKDVDIYQFQNTTSTSGSWTLVSEDYFNIYSRGGMSELEVGVESGVTRNWTIEDATWTYSAFPDENYGNFNVTQARYISGPDYHYTWYHISLNDRISSVTAAWLNVYGDLTDPPTTAYITAHFSSNDSWSEDTLTWNNQPSFSPTVIQNVTVDTDNAWYQWNVKDEVISELAGDGELTLVLKTDTVVNSGFRGWSDDHPTTTLRPRLQITADQPSSVAGRLPGGQLIDLYAGSTYSGGERASVRVNASFRKLQAAHLLVSLDPRYGSGDKTPTDDKFNGVGQWRYGWDFCVNDTWFEGVKVYFTMTDSFVDNVNPWTSENWMKWTVFWFQGNTFIKSDEVISFWESENETYSFTRFFIDIWLGMENASTVFEGRVNAFYHGYWTNWFGGQGRITAQVVSTFATTWTANNKTIFPSQVSMLNFWSQVRRNNAPPIAQHRTAKTEGLNFITATQEYVGVDEPILVETKDPEMSNWGFLEPLRQAFIGLVDALGRAVGPVLLSFWNAFVGFLDTVFTAVGWKNGFSQILSWITSLATWLVSAFTTFVQILTTFFSIVVSLVTPLTELLYVTGIFITSIFQSVFGMMNYLNLAYNDNVLPLTPAIVPILTLIGIMLPFWEITRMEEYGFGILFVDLNSVANIVAFLLNIFSTIIRMFIEIIGRIIESIPIVE